MPLFFNPQFGGNGLLLDFCPFFLYNKNIFMCFVREGASMDNDLLTAQEAAAFLKVKKATIYEMAKRGEIPSVKIGKQLRIARADLEAMFEGHASHATAEAEALSGSGALVLCGQDASLDVIANQVSALPGASQILRSYAGSYNSLNMLYHGHVDIATSHLWDEETKTYNLPYITKLLPGQRVLVVRLFGRTIGIYTAKGNPLQIHSIEDLRRSDITMINREKGSGTRILLDEKLKAYGISPDSIRGYQNECSNHISIAGTVARGEADFGMGTESATRQVPNVDFLPIQQEWYDMVLLEKNRRLPAFAMLLDYVASPRFQQELSQMGRYDFSQTGREFLL